MICTKVQELLESYIMNELDKPLRKEIEQHLEYCEECRGELKLSQDLIHSLKAIPQELSLDKDFQIKLKSKITAPSKPSRRFRIAVGGALLSTILFALSLSLMAFPAFAMKVAPSLPIVKDIHELQTEAQTLKNEAQNYKEEANDLQQEVNALKVKMEEINGTKVRVVESTPSPLTPAENSQIQSMALTFIKAQYKGDRERIKEITTPEFFKEILVQPERYLWTEHNGVIFGSITNVTKYEDVYLIFVRLSDSRDNSEFQEDFELVKQGDTFKIRTMMLDK